MKTHTQFNRRFEFQFPDVDTRILVEDLEDEVVIRASRDTFSERRKQNFIRELAAEGFIADCFQWSCRGVRWLVDASSAMPGKAVTARTNRFMIRLFVCSVLLWLAIMGGVFLREYFAR
ncbi:MAG TPA: hypothetical protein VLZ12_11300 [Verrucomicrobiae bacterium]|nr:hypothetical protein [Verrucomicrobiae bacterium]